MDLVICAASYRKTQDIHAWDIFELFTIHFSRFEAKTNSDYVNIKDKTGNTVSCYIGEAPLYERVGNYCCAYIRLNG